LSGAFATFHRATFGSPDDFFVEQPLRSASSSQIATSRRGKCHAQKFPFSRSLPGLLTMIFNAPFSARGRLMLKGV
jgi:hypothetical protein